MKRVKLYMGIPSTGTRSDTQMYSLRELEKQYADCIEFVYPVNPAYRIFHDFARNEYVKEFLESDCDAIWFLDSDICPDFRVLELVKEHWDKWEAAGACYPIFMPVPGSPNRDPYVQFTAYKGIVEGQGIALADVPRSQGVEWVDGLATGCMFLKRSVFEKLSEPYFEFKYDPKTRRLIEGEDLGFCIKLNKLGIKFLTDFSMVCKHYKTVCLLDVNNYATEMANAKLLDYDKEVRGKVQSALAAARQEGRMEALAEFERQQKTAPKKSSLILPPHFST